MKRFWTWLTSRTAPKPPPRTGPTHRLGRSAHLLEPRDLPSATAVIQAILSSPEAGSRVVDQEFQRLLDRPVDAASRPAFVAAVQQGALTREGLALILAGSDEYFTRNGGAADSYVQSLYQDFVNRPAESQAVSDNLALLSRGVPRSEVARGLQQSVEGTTVIVDDVYERFLGRDAAGAEVALWRAALPQGVGEAALIRQVGISQEFLERSVTPANYVNNLFIGILGRPAGEGEAQPFVEALNPPAAVSVLTSADVLALLRRGSAATPSRDAIISVVDRNGRILGVGAEGGVNPGLLADPQLRAFAVDGAVAKARTAAFFANNQGPLTTRTVRDLSQTTITQREVEAYPFVTDPNSTLRGPGFVAPVGIASRFPIGVANTPPVDLFGIEHTNRDSILHPGSDRLKGTPDDIPLLSTGSEFGLPRGRFDLNPAFVPAGQTLFAPESYGFQSGMAVNAQSRGIATLPGGIPIYKNGQLVGGIGVFFPGGTGFATEENSVLGTTHNPALPDRSFEAEWIAFAAAGGVPAAGLGVGAIAGEALPAGIAIPSIPPNRIDLVGVTLSIFGPAGNDGAAQLVAFGRSLGVGSVAFNALPVTPQGALVIDGRPTPEGWLVLPHAGSSLSGAEVEQMIQQGIRQATITRAAIRLPLSQATRMVFAVADTNGEILGLYRMPDATTFSIDVAVAKARNVAYYANANLLQPRDQLPGIPAGAAFSSRTFRFVALPRFPSGAEGTPPAPFSILQDGGVDFRTGVQVGQRLPASAFQSVMGYDAFNPGTNFLAGGPLPTQDVIRKQNGIVFFPGAVPVYRTGVLLGGLGVSGDGVDQDDVVTQSAAVGFDSLVGVPRADELFLSGVRLPYQNFNRNPLGL